MGEWLESVEVQTHGWVSKLGDTPSTLQHPKTNTLVHGEAIDVADILCAARIHSWPSAGQFHLDGVRAANVQPGVPIAMPLASRRSLIQRMLGFEDGLQPECQSVVAGCHFEHP